MKKSEAILRINKELTEITKFGENLDAYGFLYIAEKIIGMLPPCKSIFIEYYDKQGISGIQTMLENFKWEPKDAE